MEGPVQLAGYRWPISSLSSPGDESHMPPGPWRQAGPTWWLVSQKSPWEQTRTEVNRGASAAPSSPGNGRHTRTHGQTDGHQDHGAQTQAPRELPALGRTGGHRRGQGPPRRPLSSLAHARIPRQSRLQCRPRAPESQPREHAGPALPSWAPGYTAQAWCRPLSGGVQRNWFVLTH